jgi:ADP-ribosylation factor-like protein 6
VIKTELDALLNIPEIRNKKLPILFFCNKMDLNEAVTPEECQELLNLQKISDRSWTI